MKSIKNNIRTLAIKIALRLLRKHIVRKVRMEADFSWSAINRILMALGLGQMQKTVTLRGKTKVYFNDGQTMILEGDSNRVPLKPMHHRERKTF